MEHASVPPFRMTTKHGLWEAEDMVMSRLFFTGVHMNTLEHFYTSSVKGKLFSNFHENIKKCVILATNLS